MDYVEKVYKRYNTSAVESNSVYTGFLCFCPHTVIKFSQGAVADTARLSVQIYFKGCFVVVEG